MLPSEDSNRSRWRTDVALSVNGMCAFYSPDKSHGRISAVTATRILQRMVEPPNEKQSSEAPPTRVNARKGKARCVDLTKEITWLEQIAVKNMQLERQTVAMRREFDQMTTDFNSLMKERETMREEVAKHKQEAENARKETLRVPELLEQLEESENSVLSLGEDKAELAAELRQVCIARDTLQADNTRMMQAEATTLKEHAAAHQKRASDRRAMAEEKKRLEGIVDSLENKIDSERAAFEDRLRAVEERASASEERANAAEERARMAEERARMAEERARTAEERANAVAADVPAPSAPTRAAQVPVPVPAPVLAPVPERSPPRGTHSSNKLRDIFNAAVTTHVARNLRQVFGVLDKSKDGHLSIAELKYGLDKMELNITDADLQGLWDSLDLDHDCCITYAEFERFCLGKTVPPSALPQSPARSTPESPSQTPPKAARPVEEVATSRRTRQRVVVSTPMRQKQSRSMAASPAQSQGRPTMIVDNVLLTRDVVEAQLEESRRRTAALEKGVYEMMQREQMASVANAILVQSNMPIIPSLSSPSQQRARPHPAPTPIPVAHEDFNNSSFFNGSPPAAGEQPASRVAPRSPQLLASPRGDRSENARPLGRERDELVEMIAKYQIMIDSLSHRQLTRSRQGPHRRRRQKAAKTGPDNAADSMRVHPDSSTLSKESVGLTMQMITTHGQIEKSLRDENSKLKRQLEASQHRRQSSYFPSASSTTDRSDNDRISSSDRDSAESYSDYIDSDNGEKGNEEEGSDGEYPGIDSGVGVFAEKGGQEVPGSLADALGDGFM